MSMITLTSHNTGSVAPKLSKTMKTSSTAESKSYQVIIWLTILSFAAVLVLGVVAPIIFSYYGGTTGLGFDTDGKCAERIHSYLQSGYYVSQEQFKAAMSYC